MSFRESKYEKKTGGYYVNRISDRPISLGVMVPPTFGTVKARLRSYFSSSFTSSTRADHSITAFRGDWFPFEADVHDRATTSKETRTEIAAGIAINITTPEATLKPSSRSYLATFETPTRYLLSGGRYQGPENLDPSVLVERLRSSPGSPNQPRPRCYACSKGDSLLSRIERKMCTLRASITDSPGVISVLKRNWAIKFAAGW